MEPRHDLPSGRELAEAWQRIEVALTARHRAARRPLTWLAVSEDRTCSRD
jgi:hypothetical protein